MTRPPPPSRRRPTSLASLARLVGLVGLGLGGPGFAGELTDATSSLFSGSGNCAFCHDQWGRGLTDAQGRDVSIGTDWRATLMAHSFKDPLWRAAMEFEVERHPGLRGFIENKCQTCHAPLARTQAVHDGTNELSFAAAQGLPLAGDGVGCTLCHQIQPDHLGRAESFSGHYQINHAREIFGPYADVLTLPMQRHVDYTPKQGAHLQNSELCATCHTLFTPIPGADGAVAGEFPEQVPYLEWRNSVHATRGRHCQDCHQPRLDEPVKISSRPPWLEPRTPFWRHQFAGGNTFMLMLLKEHAAALEANAAPAQFDRMIAHTRTQLGRAAAIEVQGQRDPGVLVLRVTVENQAGHKFPTGHPYRRAWLHVRVTDPAGAVVFESGGTDDAGRIRKPGESYEPHHDEITVAGQVQVYEAVMGDANGRPTSSLLQAARYLKDNRLPPQGFRPDGPDTTHTAVRGSAAQDPDFNAGGSGCDTVTYRIPVALRAGPLEAEVALLYQAVPPEAVAPLLRASGPAARKYRELQAGAVNGPETVRRVRLRVDETSALKP